jgi:hypothetical protein
LLTRAGRFGPVSAYLVNELAARLGIMPGARVGFINDPDSFRPAVEPLPTGVRLFERASEPLDVIVYFSDTKANVERRIPLVAPYLAEEGRLWVGCPPASSEIDTDLTGQDARTIGQNNNLVVFDEFPLNTDWSLIGFHAESISD